MTEIELKLQVPERAVAALERALSVPPSARTRMQASYFDTPDRRLAAAGVALRLRKEGRRWVQTVKSGSAHGMERAEDNVVVAVAAGLQPALDPDRHLGTPAGLALAAALAAAEGGEPGGAPGAGGDRLGLVYTTDIWRRHRQQRLRHGVVELALDRGEIRATAAGGIERRWPVCELEVELVSGSPRAVLECARRLATKHGLWLDVRSKAERGERLARGLAHGAVIKAEPLRLRKAMAPEEAWTATLRNVLAQALPNWSEVAAVPERGEPSVAQPEHVHQLRVALRRLRSAQAFFAGWPGVAEPAWAEGSATLFRQLGEIRDDDVLAGGLQREIDAALAEDGQRPLGLPRPAAAARDPALLHPSGLTLIDVLTEAMLGSAPKSVSSSAIGGALAATVSPALDAKTSLVRLVSARLDEWHAQVRRDAGRFGALDDEARHRLRKRLKRLRYAIEFSESLFPRRAVERFLEPLREAQERLGEFNDVCVAQAAYRQQIDAEPRAWFALGWLARRRVEVLAAGAKDLKRLRKAEPFWTK